MTDNNSRREGRNLTNPYLCGHCGNKAPMEIAGSYAGSDGYYEEPGFYIYEGGDIFDLLACPACNDVVLRKYYWHDHMDPSEVQYDTLYPAPERTLAGLPEAIERAFEAAQRVKRIDANAYGVLIGRVLELVCQDKAATGRRLVDKLNELANKGEIPLKLVSVADGLRKLRNVGAHATLGELTDDEVPIVESLCIAVLEYVYSAPQLAQLAVMKLEELSNSKT